MTDLKIIQNKMADEGETIYQEHEIMNIRILYTIAILIWIALIFLLQLYETDSLGYVIISIPFIMFFISILNAPELSKEVESNMTTVNYLSLALLIIIPILTWLSKDISISHDVRTRFMAVIITALVLVIFTLFDIWIPLRWISYTRHGKSILQTMALTLIVMALYMYYGRRSAAGSVETRRVGEYFKS